MSPETSENLVRQLLSVLEKRGETLAVAESCTGGSLLATLTSISGSSTVVWGGVVAYANEAKTTVLGVEPSLILQEGAVSQAVSKTMAWGIRSLSGADRVVSITGIAGPMGGTPEKPVGTVWITWIGPEGRPDSRHFHFRGEREAVCIAARDEALRGLWLRAICFGKDA